MRTCTNTRKLTLFVAFIMIAITTLSLCGCGSQSPEATFKSFVDACRSGYYAAAYRMISNKTKEKQSSTRACQGAGARRISVTVPEPGQDINFR